MTIDKSALKALAEAALPYAPTWPCQEELKNIFDWPPADLMAAANPAAVLALLADLDEAENGMKHSCAIRLKKEIERLQAENESLKRDRTDWQAECLKKGFEYVREPDAHYVLADVPEMAALLGQLLEVEVRSKDNDDYGETVSSLNEQLEACNSVYGRAYDLEKEVESLRKVATELRRWACCPNLHHDKADQHALDEPCKVLARIDAAMRKPQAT